MGRVLEFAPDGTIYFKTAFLDGKVENNKTNDVDTWLKNEKEKGAKRLVLASNDENTEVSRGQPLSVQSIQQQLGFVNRKLDQEANQNVLSNVFNQSAWHGSPHNFDLFDLGAIGAGSGPQAHGWGLYFTKVREVAKAYRERLLTMNSPGKLNFFILSS